MTLKTTAFDVADYLEDDEAIADYLSEALETQDTAYISHAIGSVARAKGMSKISRDSGVKREALYKALSEAGNPQFSTVMNVFQALGLKLTAAPLSR